MKPEDTRCLRCKRQPGEPVLCPSCRDRLGELARDANARILQAVIEMAGTQVPDSKIVEPLREFASSLNLRMLDFAVAWKAPAEIRAKLEKNLSNISNPRTAAEVHLLMPDQEWEILLAHTGIAPELEQKFPVFRQLRPFRQLTASPDPRAYWQAALILEEWCGYNAIPGPFLWRSLLELRSSERGPVRDALERNGQAAEGTLRGSLHLAGSDVNPPTDEADLWRFVNDVRSATARATRDEVSPTGRDKLVSGDAPLGADSDSLTLFGVLPDADGGVFETVSYRELLMQIEQLPDYSLARAYADGVPQARIAEALGITQPAVAKRLKKFRAQARRIVAS